MVSDLGVWRTPLEPAPRLAELRGEGTGNLTLDAIFGAEIVWDGDPEAIAAEIPGAAVLPYGGSSAVGARGYVACAAELEEQAPDAAHVVVGVGSGGTMAGLVAGLGPERVLGVDTGAVPDPVERVAGFAAELGASTEGLRMRLDQVGPGYEQLTDAARQAIADAGRCEGLILDPVYTAKAMAGLAAAVADGDIKPGERTVFVHTGGLPGLFGHPYAAELSSHLGPAAPPGPGSRRRA